MISRTAAANISCLMGAARSGRRIKRCRLPELDVRRVRALRQLDANGIGLAVSVVIFAKPVAQTPGLQADDGVDVGVECVGAIEDCLSDVIAFQPLAAAGQRFIDDVLQEPLPALRLMEWAAVKDADQLFANGLLVRFAPAIGRNCHHVPTPGTLKEARRPAA